MKFDCDVKTFAKALDAAVRVVPQRATLPALSHVLLDASKDRLALTAGDLTVGLRISIPATVKETGTTTVPARLLADVVGALNADRVAVVLKDTRLRVSVGRSSTTLLTADADDYPPGPEPGDGAPVTLPREELLTGIEQVRPAVSTDSDRVLAGVMFRLDGARLVLVSTDGHRLVERRVDGVESNPESVVMPVKALVEVGRAFKEETGDVELRFAPAPNQVFFRCGSAEVSSRLLDGVYPSYDNAIPQVAATVVRAPRTELARAVRQVGVLSEHAGSGRPVRLLIDTGCVRLVSEAPMVGEAEAEIEADVEGEATQIAFNSRYLLDALSTYDVEQVELRLDGPLAPGVFHGIGAESCMYVLVPVRMAALPQATAGSQAA
ncbi:MAG TPA: DNA polymerase III subunit beta [Candidatus Dormibacteraeota bacterium]|nr:DNA polymerase III subunit beta [Candidatus Dormibacteraeota bacterium]